jgi:CBS domain containing-hemolysin-like protein
MDTAIGILGVAALVALNGWFVAAEYALVTVRPTRVEQLVSERRLGALSLQHAVDHLESYIATCQLGITVASLALGWIGEPALAGLIEPAVGGIASHAVAAAITFLVITTLLVAAGELAPKGLALQHTERVALLIAGPLGVFRSVFRPAIWVLTNIGWGIARVAGVRRGAARETAFDATELVLLLRESRQAGEIDEQQLGLIERSLRFSGLSVEQAMIPRTEVLAIPFESTVAEATALARESRHSRYPVFRDSIDDIAGVLHLRDMLFATAETPIAEIVRDPLVLPGQAAVADLLRQMRDRRVHIAIVVDEYGGTDGIVTLEDVVEELIGELQDEFEPRELAGRPARARRAGVVRLSGLDATDVLEEQLGVTVEEGQYQTVAGYVVDQLGRIPEVGDSIEAGGYRITVTEMDELRVAALEATRLPTAQPSEESQASDRPTD